MVVVVPQPNAAKAAAHQYLDAVVEAEEGGDVQRPDARLGHGGGVGAVAQ